jgi:hypothetical protein
MGTGLDKMIIEALELRIEEGAQFGRKAFSLASESVEE